MPPINKRPKTSIPGLPTGPAPGVQDYRDPFKKTILNPEPLNPMELVLKQQRERTVAKAAQAGATGKQRKAGAKAVRVLQQTQKAPTAKALERMRIVEEGEAALRYNLNDPLLENSEKLKEVRSEMDRQYYQDQVENGPLLAETSPLVRGFDRAVASTTKELGTIVSDVVPVKRLMTDLFGNDEGVKALFDIGEYISSLGAQAEGELAQFHQYEKSKEAKSLYERGMEFLGSAPVSLAKYATVGRLTGGGAGASFTRQTTGTALGFGGLRVVEAQARGEKDPKRLTEEFALGAVTGALLTSLGKTADVVGHYSKLPGISTLAKAPRTTQAGAQFLGGVAQTHAETFIARDTDSPPDSFDYLAGGLFNVALDPVVFGPSQKAKKATAIAVESTAKWANDQIPPSGLAELRDDFWQPMDVPWSEKVTADLLKRARAQFVEAPGEPEGTLFVNPQAAMILQRLGESLDNPSARVAASTSQGTSLTTEAAQLLSARARAKANEVKQVVAQLPNGHEKLIPYAESAVMYESLADTLDAATAGNRPLNMRFIRQSDMTDPTNPTAVKWSDKVIGHESWHAQDHKTAASVKANWNTLTDPLWLMEHPLGAKLFSTMGDEGNPLGQTGAEHLTGEALAYAAQPGESPIGLTTQERGILVGDYLAHLQDKYGGGILAQRYAGRIDREVAKVAFRRLYEAGRVKFARNGEGKAIGLEWPDIVPPMNQEIPNDPYRGVYQPPLMVGPKEKVNKAIHLNDLWQRFRQSKVRNSKGELIPVYHGSPKGVEIVQVDLNKLNPNDWLHGLFTTQDPKVASGYAMRSGAGDTGQGSNVHKFYLDARNPLDLDAPIPEDLITGLSQVLGIDIGESAKHSDANYILGEIRQQLRDPRRNKEFAAISDELDGVSKTLHEIDKSIDKLFLLFDAHAYANDLEYRNSEYAKQTKAKIDALEAQSIELDKRRIDLVTRKEELLKTIKPPSNLAVIQQLRDALLYLGYDSATHIGGGDAAGRYFKTEAEALAEIDKTGGTLDVRTVEKLAGQLGLELAKKYNLNYETVDYTSIPVIKRFVDLLTAPTNSLVGRIVPENLGRVVKSAEQVLNTYARFSVEHMDDARIDLRWDISIDELRSITVDKLNLMSGAKFDRLVDQTDGWMHDAVVDSLSYADKLKVKEEALKYKRESLTGAEELATAARDVFDEIERQGIERYSTDYIVQGHRVWIAFKPEQVVSATAYSPAMERYLGNSMPLNIEPDPTILTSTIEETGDITADSLDDIRQINVETISPEQKTVYDGLMSEQTKARNDYRKLAKDLRFAKAAIEAERELQTRSGVDRSESITGLRKYAEDLARRTEAAKVAAKESTVRVNDFRDSLVAELGENTVFGVAPSLSDRAKAIERLKDIANEVPADGDMQQMIMATTKMYAYDRILTDTLISLGPQWNPKRFPDTPLSDLFHQAVAAGHVNIELFSKVLDSNNLSMGEFAQLSRDTIRVAARLMSSKSRAKRILNKMFKADAEFQDWFDKSVPTVREMQALARGRSNIQRILHLGQSLMLTQPATMAMNSIGGGVNVGLRVYLNAFNAGLQKLFYNTRFAGEYFDDSSQTDKRIVPSSFTEIVAPIRELWQVFGYGKEFGKPIPSVQIQAAKNKNILRLQKLIDAFPEVEGKLLAPLEADVESIGTEREAQTLQIWEKQIDLLPAGPKKRRLTQELATAKNRALNEQTRISTRLRQGEALVHRMLRLNRAQEQFFRIGTFLGQLDNYAKQQNIDLVDLEAKNDLSAIPDDLVNRAMEDALEATYGRRPSPRARQGSFDALWYSATRFMNDKLLSGTLVYFPNFAVNFLRQHLELNPLTGIRLLRAMHRSEYAQGNYDAIGKSIFGAMALGAAWLIRSSRYDEEEGKSNLREVGNWPGGTEWYSVGGVDLRPTPFAPFLAMADIYERQRRGLPQQIKTPGQLLQAFGTEQRNLTGMADWLDKALQQLTDGSLIAQDKLKQTAGSAIGEWVSHFATPFQMLTDVVSIFDADQRKLKDTRGMFQGAIIDPTLAKIPYLRNGLPDRIDPLTGRPMVNADSAAGPIARQLTGFRLLPEKSYVGTVFAENGIALRDWIPFTGIPEVDRELVATIARNVSKMTEQYETADIRNRPLDEQVAEMFADYKTEAVAALADTLSKYPELDDYLLERKELNFWERRVEERQQKAKGLPTAEEIYRKRRTERLAKP